MERTNTTLVHKKSDPLDKENYRPVSILPLLSKVYERAIFNQLSVYMQNVLNKILCGFRKAHNTHKLLQEWQRELDESGNAGTILIDLSKAYDCIPHDLLMANFNKRFKYSS